MNLLLWGVNHHSAPLAVREALVLEAGVAELLYPRLQNHLLNDFPQPLLGFVVLSTCNRLEIYLASDVAVDLLVQSLQNFFTITEKNLAHIFTKTGDAVAAHVFALVAGMDSMVVGETQIAGQIKHAYAFACQQQVLSSLAKPSKKLPFLLHHLFQSGFSAAKKIRTASHIGQGTISYAAATVQLAERVYGELQNAAVLLVGAGEMMRLVASHFASRSPRQFFITNHRNETITALIQRFNAVHLQSLTWDTWQQNLHCFDIVVVCTAANQVILSADVVLAATKKREMPMVYIDLALPRNIDSQVKNIKNIYAYTLDDVGKVAEQGRRVRGQASQAAEAMVGLQVEVWRKTLAQRVQAQQHKTLQLQAQQMANRELLLAQRLLQRGIAVEEVLSRLTHRINAKWLDGVYKNQTPLQKRKNKRAT